MTPLSTQLRSPSMSLISLSGKFRILIRRSLQSRKRSQSSRDSVTLTSRRLLSCSKMVIISVFSSMEKQRTIYRLRLTRKLPKPLPFKRLSSRGRRRRTSVTSATLTTTLEFRSSGTMTRRRRDCCAWPWRRASVTLRLQASLSLSHPLLRLIRAMMQVTQIQLHSDYSILRTKEKSFGNSLQLLKNSYSNLLKINFKK